MTVEPDAVAANAASVDATVPVTVESTSLKMTTAPPLRSVIDDHDSVVSTAAVLLNCLVPTHSVTLVGTFDDESKSAMIENELDNEIAVAETPVRT